MFDFSSADIAEYIVSFLFKHDLLNSPREFNMSMLEFVTFVCPDEFADYLKSCGVPEVLYKRQ